MIRLIPAAPFLLIAYDLSSQQKVITRTLRTVRCGLRILWNYKIAFNENNFMEIHQYTARDIYETCLANDGLYVKFGQGLAANAHILPPPYMRWMKKFQDQAKSVPYEVIKAQIENQLKRPLEQVFQSISSEPVASASVAQVHRARLLNGDQVAVKIQKPNIKHQFRADMLMHKVICGVLDYAFDIPLLAFQSSIQQNLRKQLDFRIQSENSKRAAAGFRASGRTAVHIPKVHQQFTTNHLLITQWIDGIKITDESKLKLKGHNPFSIISEVVQAFAQQIFLTGFVHCDPHPGNVFVRDNPVSKGHQIVILDHGLCISVDQTFRKQYADFWVAMFTHDKEKMKSLCQNWGIRFTEAFASSQLMRPYKQNKPVQKTKLSNADIYKLQGQLKDSLKNMFLDQQKFPREMMFINRNMMLIKSLNKHFGSVIDRVNIMATFASRAKYVNFDTQQKIHNYKAKFSELKFRVRLWLIRVRFLALQWLLWWRGVESESLIEQQQRLEYENRFAKFGFKPIDKSHYLA